MGIRHRLSISMTRGADVRRVLLKSLGLSVLCTLVTVPYFQHLLSVSLKARNRLSMPFDLHEVLIMESFLLFMVCLLSAIVGFSFSKKLQLPGLGDPRRFTDYVPILLGLGALMGGLTYVLFDRHFFYISPASYPTDILYIISYPFKVGLTNEVILRFCLVTLCVGIFKNKLGGVILISAIAAVFTKKYFRFLGIDYPFNYLFITQFLISFFVNFILGYIFITWGLLWSMVLHFLFGARLIVVLWLLG